MDVNRHENTHIKQEINFPEGQTIITGPSIKLEDGALLETINQNNKTHLLSYGDDNNCSEIICTLNDKEHQGLSVPVNKDFCSLRKEYKKAKLYCRKCGDCFDFKCDLFNHMFLHIDIIMAEAEYIRSTRKAGSEAICKDDEEKHSRENDCKNDNVEKHLELNQSTEPVLTGGTIKYESSEDLDEVMGGFESDDSIQAEHGTSQKEFVSMYNENGKDEMKKSSKTKPQIKKKSLDKMQKVKVRVKKKKLKKAKEKDVSEVNITQRKKRNHELQIYECDDCSYKTPQLWTMRKHCVIHLPNNPFKCSLCDFACKKKHNLKCHMTTHTKEMPHKCEHCGRCFGTRSVWSRHVKTHNEKKYTCHICGKKFHRSDSLQDHLASHSDQRPHKCHICPYGAKHIRALKMHLKGHGAIKRYECPLCDFKTATRSTLAKHNRIHNSEAQYKCDKCTFSCRAQLTFKKHCRVHNTSAHVFSCSECDFKSTMERAVMRHLRQHQNIPLKMLQMKVKALNHNILSRV